MGCLSLCKLALEEGKEIARSVANQVLMSVEALAVLSDDLCDHVGLTEACEVNLGACFTDRKRDLLKTCGGRHNHMACFRRSLTQMKCELRNDI